MRTWATVLLGFTISSFEASVASAVVWDVPGDAPTIQAGIDSAASGDTVLVASGTYTEDMQPDATFGYSMLVMKSGVRLRSSSGAAATILDADSLGRVILVEDCASGTLIEGFTIRAGDVSGGLVEPNGSTGYGGGVAVASSDLSMEACVLQSNAAKNGGGLWTGASQLSFDDVSFVDNLATVEAGALSIEDFESDPSSATATDCVFDGNMVVPAGSPIASNTGGAVCIYASASATFSYCQFSNNSAPQAGVGHWSGGSTLSNCTFSNNSATLTSAGSGGALWVAGGSSHSIDDCVFTGNTATLRAGALYISGGAYVECTNTDFIENDAEYGGALATNYTNAAEFHGCTFVDNTAGSSGGAVAHLSGVTMTTGFDWCLFSGNEANGLGGAVYLSGYVVNWLQHCTLADNTASTDGGGGVYVDNLTSETNPVFEHVIIAENDGGGAVQCDGDVEPELSCCDVWGNVGDDYIDCLEGQDGSDNNISDDPEFCGDGPLPYAVSNSSPCHNLANCGTIGSEGSGCAIDPKREPREATIGATSWGSLKSRFRGQVDKVK